MNTIVKQIVSFCILNIIYLIRVSLSEMVAKLLLILNYPTTYIWWFQVKVMSSKTKTASQSSSMTYFLIKIRRQSRIWLQIEHLMKKFKISTMVLFLWKKVSKKVEVTSRREHWASLFPEKRRVELTTLMLRI